MATRAGSDASDTGAGGSGGLEEIIVTAERREESVQNTPIAISAFGGDSLQKQQIVNIEGLSAQIPNVEFGRGDNDARVVIRGIGLDAISAGSEPRVAIYTDGVYNGRAQAALGNFFDIERVEVLRGPQGTLYGRNATAGAINIISRDPGNELNGYGTMTLGNHDLIRTEGAIGGRLSDTISARVAIQTVDHSGYGVNIGTGQLVDDEHSRAVRGKIALKPTSNVNVLLEADYSREDDTQSGFRFIHNTPGNINFGESIGYAVPSNPRDYAGHGPNYQLYSNGTSATVTIDLGGPVITSITGFKHLESFMGIDADESTAGFLPVQFREAANQLSQELRLADKVGPVDLLIGGYYFHDLTKVETQAQISGAYFALPPPTNALRQGADFGGTQKTNAYAAFTSATVHVTDALGIDLGVRYSSEKRDLNEFAQVDFTRIFSPSNPKFLPGLVRSDTLSTSASSVDPKATIHYNISKNTLIYATYSRGFKTGGFNIGALNPPFKPEKLTDYEVGIKTDLFDRRLRANIAGFWYDYKNIQVQTPQGFQLITTNAGAGKEHGIELELTALPVDDLRITLNFGWLHTKFTNFTTVDFGRPALGLLNLTGNSFSYAPKYKVDGGIDYTFHASVGEITPRVNVSWSDRIYFSQFNLNYVSQPAFAEENLFLDYKAGDSGWSATAFIRNLTDKLYLTSETVASDYQGFAAVGRPGNPRTFGLSVTKRF